MRKTICALLCLCCFISLTGCSSGSVTKRLEKVLTEEQFLLTEVGTAPTSSKYYQTRTISEVFGQPRTEVTDYLCANTVSPELVVSSITYVEFKNEQTARSIFESKFQSIQAKIKDSSKKNGIRYDDNKAVAVKLDMSGSVANSGEFWLLCRSGSKILYITAEGPMDKIKEYQYFYMDISKAYGTNLSSDIKPIFLGI